MPFPNIFKKKKPEKKIDKKPEKNKAVEEKPKQQSVKEKPQPVRKSRKIDGEAYKVLRAPHVTEKANFLVGKNQYVFKVYSRANKSLVKRAVEDVFGVDVVSVRIINVPKRKRRLGRIEGWRKGYKKAIIKIKEGHKIEVLPR
ncbi:MAG: 50S ribosomal protein L23 [bacterium]